jgi:hypothetical protein
MFSYYRGSFWRHSWGHGCDNTSELPIDILEEKKEVI